MSEKKETRRLRLPEELLDKVSGGYTMEQLTQEEVDHINMLCDGYAQALVMGHDREKDRYIELLLEYHAYLENKYDK